MANFFEWASKALDDLDSGMATKINEIKKNSKIGNLGSEASSQPCELRVRDDDGNEKWVEISACDKSSDGTYTVTVADTPLANELGIAFDVRDSIPETDLKGLSKESNAPQEQGTEEIDAELDLDIDLDAELADDTSEAVADNSEAVVDDSEAMADPGDINEDTIDSQLETETKSPTISQGQDTVPTRGEDKEENLDEGAEAASHGPGQDGENGGVNTIEENEGENADEGPERSVRADEMKPDFEGPGQQDESAEQGENDTTGDKEEKGKLVDKEESDEVTEKVTNADNEPEEKKQLKPKSPNKQEQNQKIDDEKQTLKPQNVEQKVMEKNDLSPPTTPKDVPEETPSPDEKGEDEAVTNSKVHVKKAQEDSEKMEIHWGVACDMLGQNPIKGIRWSKKGEDYDLCQEAYDSLSQTEKDKYTPIFKSELPPPTETTHRSTPSLGFGDLTKSFTRVTELVKKHVPKSQKKKRVTEIKEKLKGKPSSANVEEIVKVLEEQVSAAERRAEKAEHEFNGIKEELEEKEQENASLRQVWNETRTSLQRTQRAMRANEDRYRNRLMERESLHKRQTEAKERELKQTILKLKREVDDLRKSHDKSLSLRDNSVAAAEAERLQVERRMTAAVAEAASLRETIGELEEKNEDLVRARELLTQEHAKTLQDLRSKHEQMQALLETERRNKGSVFSELKSREGYLEENNAEIASALAEAQRQVDEKARMVERVRLEAQWAKADQKASEEQLAATRERLELAEANYTKMKKESKQSRLALEKQLRDAKSQNEKLASTISAKSIEIRELEDKLEQAIKRRQSNTPRKGGKSDVAGRESKEEEGGNAARSQRDVDEEDEEDHSYESKIKTMAQHLMKKQNEVDRVTAHRNALALQLEAEQRAVKALEKKLRVVRTNSDAEYYRNRAKGGKNDQVSINMPKGSTTTSSAKFSAISANTHPSVAKAMRFLDSFSSFISVMLRRNPAARLFFGLYVLMIHLWVLFVLFHFMGHDHDDHVEQVSSIMPAGSTGMAPPGV
eukprot:CAMPEP_0184493538 /NCGR_PEP_ID=MMETSP0113_2-20130426/26235_1 /TAXON_ID=91329 /ORGANISM="Norrisiella sphaerica, Strain BC52" /LENGTH=1020 /DNA_ID=CAMNT_0026878831 /DNA_START=127 /DNA_END=3189 /DNA_ORIENTATION=+